MSTKRFGIAPRAPLLMAGRDGPSQAQVPAASTDAVVAIFEQTDARVGRGGGALAAMAHAQLGAGGLDAQGGPVEAAGPDRLDRASDREDMGLERHPRVLSLPRIAGAVAALRRIEEGTYGYCEKTAEPIGLKRLEARPIATLSLEAQERHERLERTKPRRIEELRTKPRRIKNCARSRDEKEFRTQPRRIPRPMATPRCSIRGRGGAKPIAKPRGIAQARTVDIVFGGPR